MIRVVRALLWMRFRALLNTLRGKSRRDALERTSRIVSSLLPVALLVLLLPTTILLAAGGFAGGMAMAARGSAYIGAPMVLTRVVLFLMMLVVVLAPLVRSARGGDAGLTRLLLLPIRRGVLHLAEVVSSLSDPWLALLIPLLIMPAPAFLISGRPDAALVSLVSGILLLLTLASMNTCASFISALLFRERRRAEWFTLLLIVLISVAALLLAIAADDDWGASLEQARLEGMSEQPRSLLGLRSDQIVPIATQLVPSELYFAGLALGVEGRHARSLVPLGLLAAWNALLFWLSWTAYRRLIETPESSTARGGGRNAATRMPVLPGLGPAASAVALAAVRLALRSVRGKLGVYLNCLILGIMFVAFTRQSPLARPGMGLSGGMLIALAGFLFSLLSLQPILLNQFAIDRSGLTLQVLSPLSARDLVRGKQVAVGVLVALSSGLCLLTGLLLAPGGDPLLWAALVPVCLSAYVLLAPLASVLSAVFPKTADLSQLGKAGNAHVLAGFVGLLLSLAVTAPSVLLCAGALVVFDSSALALLLAAGWLVVAGLIAVPLQRLAERMLEERCENLLLVAASR